MALPFFFLALFPAVLKKMPRSGGWLVRVKIVLGFVILAASLKYLSAVDQTLGLQWLTRERFLAAWIVLFAMAGCYLLGLLRLEGVKPDEPLKLGRLAVGTAFLIFAVSLVPGMSSGKLGDLDAYVPAPAGRAFALEGRSGPSWLKDQYREALDQARREGKLVFINFTGVACANCHWMEANMLPRPEIAAALERFVLVELFTDRADAVSEANEKLEETKFGTVAEPYYAIVRPDGSVVATFEGRTTDAPEFLAFLSQGTAPATQSASPGASAAGFTALDGSAIEGSGKVLVLDFWATWCVCLLYTSSRLFRLVQRCPGQNAAGIKHGAALADNAAEQSSGQGRSHQRTNRGGSGGFAADGHFGGIASKRGDVALDPPQGRHLIQHAVVAGRLVRRFGGEFGMGEEAEHAEPVIDGDHDDALLGEVGAVVARFITRSGRKTAAVKVHQHGQAFLSRRRRPDVQICLLYTSRCV